ncbi:MAG: efflux RND transporter periplasmic adaptor subunit [Capsulimonadales bacterium]|nr:efflux RND transporter periplasmic adaptor subunit [Capsulimonadales bacterium]
MLVPIVVLIAVVGGIFFFTRQQSAASSKAGVTQYKVAKVETGEVKKTVSASGTLQAWNVVDIKARTGGELSLLRVDVGDEVRKDDLLARIDPLDVSLTLNQARANHESAIARKAQNTKSFQLQEKQTDISIQDARAALLSAEANLQSARASLRTAQEQANAQPTLTEAAIDNAKAAYDQAVKQLAQLKATNQQQKAAAQATYDQAVANRTNARQSLERQQALVAKGFVAQSAVDSAQANLSVLDAQVNSARTKLDTVDAELAATLQASEARVAQTRAALESAKAGSIDIVNRRNSARQAQAAVRQAEAQVERARVALRQALANRTNNDIRKLDITTANATIASANAALVNAQISMQRTEIRSPMEGVVLQKYVNQGTIISSALGINSAGQSIIQLGDVSRMYVDVNVDETDIANVDINQVVEVNIEAYPGVPFEGKVIRINPLAQVEQNVTTIHVRVEVDNSSPTFRLLKPGMNATCEFVIGKKPDVVKVPNEAIREDDQGQYVEIASGGKPAPPDPQAGTPAPPPDPSLLIDIKKERRAIKAGLAGNDATEITEGVKPGDQIITQTIEPAPPQQAGSPFGGGGFGGRGMGGMGGGRGR